MKLTHNQNKVCKCGHTIWYHETWQCGGKCTFVGCNCYKYIDSKQIKASSAFLGGFTYTEDEICECKHGWWHHLTPKGKVGKCNRIMAKNKIGMTKNKIGKCTFIKCTCKKFLSKVKIKKLKEVKR